MALRLVVGSCVAEMALRLVVGSCAAEMALRLVVGSCAADKVKACFLSGYNVEAVTGRLQEVFVSMLLDFLHSEIAKSLIFTKISPEE
jgi:hypothetical protein